jgi:predicted negative regulator of RcsB-dependent stress response
MTDETRRIALQERPYNPNPGILEQLNLPPKTIAFMRENARNLKVGAVALLVVGLAIFAFDSYQESQREKSNTLLYRATQATSASERQTKLQEVVATYPRTSASLWAQLELAHADRQAGKLDEALVNYSAVHDRLAKDSPVAPLVLLAMGQTNEAKGELDKAFAFYEKAAMLPGFVLLGKTGLARVHEQRQQWAEARAIYEALRDDVEIQESDKAWITAKLETLAGAGAKQ